MPYKQLLQRIRHRLIPAPELPLPAEERKRIESLERYVPASLRFYSRNLDIVDSVTFLNSYNEIFLEEIYKFIPETDTPVIIDCGANIGLASLYFKMQHPCSIVLAYEPDPNIFKAMTQNMKSFGYDDIICINEAISDKEDIVNFQLEGGHSGMIAPGTGQKNIVKIKSARLKTVLEKFERITFLKIDIEGHERKIFSDIAEDLKKVDFLFLEYHSFINEKQNLDVILKVITGAGMKYYIKEAYNKQFPFISREIFLEMDMLINIFCYR